MRNPQDRVGTVLANKYNLQRLLGAGGMGVVYEAQSIWTQRRLAIKLLSGAAAADQHMVERFLREARAATRIGHPNIVEVLGMGRDESDGTLYIVQEFLQGRELRQLLDERISLPLGEAVRLLVPIMDALEAAHQNGIVHRDIKPENIFLSEPAPGVTTPKLIDFGIAKISGADVSHDITSSGLLIGTPRYMSPEQARDASTIDAQTDVWAMGVVLFEALSGRRPFDGDTYNRIISAVLLEDAPRLDAVAELSSEVADVVQRALTRDRGVRFSTMQQVIDALLRCSPVARDTSLVPLARTTAMGSEEPSRSGTRASAKLTPGFGAKPHRNKASAARSRREAAQKSDRTFGERH